VSRPVLYDFFRSTSAWRTRIALNLKGIAYEHSGVWVRGDAHRGADYMMANPQGLVPALRVNDTVIPQSIAIIEYLDAVHPNPALLPKDELKRAVVRSAALLIACDIHPINNRRVLQYLGRELKIDEEGLNRWECHWIAEGFGALETQARRETKDAQFLFADTVTLADICLVPQVANGQRAGLDIAKFPRLAEVHARLVALPAFVAASPEHQPDAVAH
jgi:maleylacetoacetate isomerase